MKKWIKAIVPSFLWRLDNFLLIHHPLFWASRLHFFLYFQCLLMIFGVLLTSFQRITFLNVPEPFWILLYVVIANLIMLIIWVYFQALIHIYRFHGFTRLGFSLKVCLIFYFCMIVIFISTIIPYFNLNRRIYNAFSEPSLPSRHASFQSSYDESVSDTLTSIDTTAFNLDTVQSLDAFKYEKLYLVQKLFDSLPKSVKENISVVLKEAKLEKFKNLELNNKAVDPYLTYEVNYYNNYFSDTLKIFYTSPFQYDSIQSEKFDCIVWIKKFRGRVNDRRDTVISRYYFFSKVDRTNLIGTADNIQELLLEDRIKEAVNKAYPKLEEYGRIKMVNSLFLRYVAAEGSLKESPNGVVALIHFFMMMAFIIMLLHVVVHLFGIRTLFLGLLLPVLLVGLFISVTYLSSRAKYNSTLFYSILGVLILAGLVIGVIKLPFAKKTFFRLIGLQLFIYFVWLLLLILPYYLFDLFYFRPQYRTPYYLTCMILAVGLSALLMRHLYRIYTQPIV